MADYREIDVNDVIDKVAEGFQDACYTMRDDVLEALQKIKLQETEPLGCYVLDQLIENAEIAHNEMAPFCHDTGVAILFVEMGQDVRLAGGSLTEALHEGVRRGYTKGYLRASIVKSPLSRENTKDNTPAIIHYEIVPGNQLTISLTAKGGGSENKSRQVMLKPSDGTKGIVDFAVETVSLAGASGCPPVILGIGIGGSFDYCTYLAKKSLFRKVGSINPDPSLASLEDEIHEACNKLGIGPQGMGGVNTVMDVFIEVWPCHIASLPLAVNIQCPASRHRTIHI